MNAALSLPPIALADLPERTKDFLIAVCNGSDLTPEEAVRRVLDRAAEAHALRAVTPVLADVSATAA